MGRLPNQYMDGVVLRSCVLPVFDADGLWFYRCVVFDDCMYGRTVSELHAGNLRVPGPLANRHSRLFPDRKVSYWADTMNGAIGEVRKWNGNGVRNRLLFTAYDDFSSTFPMMGVTSRLRIIDGRSLCFDRILEKDSKNECLSQAEQQLVDAVLAESPDGLVYKSYTKLGHVNFLFFESGFNKLALRSVGLWLNGRKRRLIECAHGSDYSPDLAHYGDMFMPVAKVAADRSYLFTEEYLVRKRNYEQSVSIHK